MYKILKLALKNLTRQKRRNAILAFAIAFGFFVVTAIDGLVAGMVNNFEDMITQMVGGTVLIGGFEKNQPENPDKKPELINIIRDRDYIKSVLDRSNIDYKYFSSSTVGNGQIIFNGKKSIIRATGRDFSEKDFLGSFQIVDGNLEDLTLPDSMIINQKLAENLNLQVGDQLIFMTNTIYGQNTVGDYVVRLITKSSSFADNAQVFVNIENLNALLGIPEGGYSLFSVFIKDKKDQVKIVMELEDIIRQDGVLVTNRRDAMKISPKNIGRGISKQITGDDYTWEGTKYILTTLIDEVPAIKTVMNVVHMVTTIILIVILLIVMVGVSNTYRMVLMERIREIGTMRALGMTRKDTRRVFTTEAIILCLTGAVAGLIIALIAMLIVHAIPIKTDALGFFLSKGHFSFTLSAATILAQYILLIILTSFAVFGSAKKASEMNPAEALRSVK